ncbi:MAG: hypothetical protein EXS34_04565 [Lacunisphaera sp.]|nr:hypothetical protein [Lacunisphaera sp.]
MLIATFNKHEEAFTVGYAMDSDRKPGEPDLHQPLVLQGDPVMFDQFDHAWNDFASPHLAIAASCSEKLAPAEARELWLRMIDIYLPGLCPGQVATLGVHHRESALFADARSAVHGFIMLTNLLTGRRIQPYYHDSRDAIRVELGQELLNLSHGWTSPKDPAKARVAVASSPGPGSTTRRAWATSFTDQFRLFSDEDLRDPTAIRVSLAHSGAQDIRLSTTTRGHLRASFHCRDHTGRDLPVSVVLHPDRRERQLLGSAIRDLIGPRLQRTPEVFTRLKEAFLVELAHGREELDRRHGSSDPAYDRVITWARGLELAQARVPKSITEDFGKILPLRPPMVMDGAVTSSVLPLFPADPGASAPQGDPAISS